MYIVFEDGCFVDDDVGVVVDEVVWVDCCVGVDVDVGVGMG